MHFRNYKEIKILFYLFEITHTLFLKSQISDSTVVHFLCGQIFHFTIEKKCVTSFLCYQLCILSDISAVTKEITVDIYDYEKTGKGLYTSAQSQQGLVCGKCSCSTSLCVFYKII